MGNLHSTTNIIGGGIFGRLLLNVYRLRLSIIALYASQHQSLNIPLIPKRLGGARKKRDSLEGAYVEDSTVADSLVEGGSIPEAEGS